VWQGEAEFVQDVQKLQKLHSGRTLQCHSPKRDQGDMPFSPDLGRASLPGSCNYGGASTEN
jgi:hypothetical protein